MLVFVVALMVSLWCCCALYYNTTKSKNHNPMVFLSSAVRQQIADQAGFLALRLNAPLF